MDSCQGNSGDIAQITKPSNSRSKPTFRVTGTFVVRGVPGKFEENESKQTFEFFCHHDPNPVVFKLVLYFDESGGSKVLQLGLALGLGFSKAKPGVRIVSLKCSLHDHEKNIERL